MLPTARQPKGNPTRTAALKVLERLQQKHGGVVEASDFKDDEWSQLSGLRVTAPMCDHHDQGTLPLLSRTANLQTASQARRPRVAFPLRVPDR